jgi:hypothetical protein
LQLFSYEQYIIFIDDYSAKAGEVRDDNRSCLIRNAQATLAMVFHLLEEPKSIIVRLGGLTL